MTPSHIVLSTVQAKHVSMFTFLLSLYFNTHETLRPCWFNAVPKSYIEGIDGRRQNLTSVTVDVRFYASRSYGDTALGVL